MPSSFDTEIEIIASNMKKLNLGHKNLPEVPKKQTLRIATDSSECCVCMELVHYDTIVAKFSACSHWVCSIKCSDAFGPNKCFQMCPLCRTEVKDPPKNEEFILYKNLPMAPTSSLPLLSAGRGPIPDASPENIRVGIIYQ